MKKKKNSVQASSHTLSLSQIRGSFTLIKKKLNFDGKIAKKQPHCNFRHNYHSYHTILCMLTEKKHYTTTKL